MRALAQEPFNLPLEKIADLTDRQMWVWYIRPALERQENERRDRETVMGPGQAGTGWHGSRMADAPPLTAPADHDGLVNERGEPVSVEAFFAALAGAGVKIQEGQKREDGKDGDAR